MSHPLRIAMALWIAAGVAVSVRTFLKPVSHTVFPILVAGVDHWWADEPLYADYKPLDYFRYPPPFAVLMSPLGWMGPRVGGIVWAWLSLGVYYCGLRAFAKGALPVTWNDTKLAIYFSLCLFGGLRGLWNGQSNAFIVGLILIGTAALMERRWWKAGLLLAAATTIKLTPIAIALLLCGLYPKQLALRFVAALAVYAAVPFATKPPDIVVNHYREWSVHLVESSSERWPGFRDAWTVWQVVGMREQVGPEMPWLKDPLESGVYRGLQLVTAFFAFLYSQWLRQRGLPDREIVTRTLAAGLAWLMVFGPAVEHATYVFIAPVLCWAILEPGEGRLRNMLAGISFVLVMVLGWGSLTRPLLDSIPTLLVALPIGTSFFAAWLALGEQRRLS